MTSLTIMMYCTICEDYVEATDIEIDVAGRSDALMTVTMKCKHEESFELHRR